MTIKKIKKIVYECSCERCTHKWETKTEELPMTCPKCKSPYWNKPRRKGKGESK